MRKKWSKPKYDRGDNACGNCSQGRHTKCRPKLDRTVCSCSCEIASTNRGIAEDGAGKSTPDELLLPFYPRILKKDEKVQTNLLTPS